jgi:hypothetical protein
MSAIEDMAKRALCEVQQFGDSDVHRLAGVAKESFEADAAIIARHYRVGVRELLLAARGWAGVAEAESMDEYRNRKARLRKALEGYADVK